MGVEHNISTAKTFDVAGDIPRYAIPFAGGTHDFAALGYGRTRRIIALADADFSNIKYAVKKNGTNLVVPDSFTWPAGVPFDCAGVLEITVNTPIVVFFD